MNLYRLDSTKQNSEIEFANSAGKREKSLNFKIHEKLNFESKRTLSINFDTFGHNLKFHFVFFCTTSSRCRVPKVQTV
jgi:hypothetical protein